MNLPGMSDNSDAVIELLAQIAENTSGSRDTNTTQDVTVEGSEINKRQGVIPHGSVRVIETSDLDDANDDGTITLSPGEKATLVEYRGSASATYAVGATDVAGVVYWLEVDGNPVIGPTNGPLGTVPEPFSFIQNYGGAVPSSNRVAYKALYPDDQTGQIDLSSRIHLEVLE